MNLRFGLFIVGVLAVAACVHTQKVGPRKPASGDGTTSVSAVMDLPIVTSFQISNQAVVKDEIPAPIVPLLNRYFSFLNLPFESSMGKDVYRRLLNSSLQFLECPDLEDWDCLEKSPQLQPTATFRQETSPDLGERVERDRPFKVQPFFTMKYYDNYKKGLKVPPDPGPSEITVAKSLGKIIDDGFQGQNWGGLSLAFFGMDDLDGTMKPVWGALNRAKQNGVNIRGVFDVKDVDPKLVSPIYVSMLEPMPTMYQDKNFFSVLNLPTKIKRGGKVIEKILPHSVSDFQYAETPRLIHFLNSGVSDESQSRGRIEWPVSADIMHNKFMVFADKANHPVSVWTGTANVAQTCMGNEANANMSVYIEDADIAQTFLGEFNEMFESNTEADTKKDSGVFFGPGGGPVAHGKFHRKKRPQTKRFFSYNDGTEVRVHFSPTDDGEHRAILPMLLSAREGDEIRIAMFAAGGIEFVRALQLAAARGAHVQIVFDSTTNGGCFSWIHAPLGNIRQANPYSPSPKGEIDFRVNGWVGLVHQKAATLTRKNPAGATMIPEVLIVGSQNWSEPGNDDNDENMITMRNRRSGLDAAKKFNEHFDQFLWNASVPLAVTAEKTASCAVVEKTPLPPRAKKHDEK